VNLRALVSELGARAVTGLMVEGGSETLWGFFAEGLVDRAAVFVAPRFLGGRGAPGGVGGEGFSLGRTPRLADVRVEAIGGDLLVTGRLA